MLEIKHAMGRMMTRIVAVRYTDLEEEKRLCIELLTWAQTHRDAYALAFARTYLGDYALAIYDQEQAGQALREAEHLLQEDESWDSLRLRVYSLQGIYCDIRADEQNAIEYYLKAIPLAEKLGDVAGHGVVLNNLAFAFQRSNCYDAALEYYQKAYALQQGATALPFWATLLGNLAEVNLSLGRYDKAKAYILEYEAWEQDPGQMHKALCYRCWCSYYASIAERDKALENAAGFLQYKRLMNENKLIAFENYYALCEKMMLIGSKDYAAQFLNAMEEISPNDGLDPMKMLEDLKIRYALQFEPKEKHGEAYHRFYKKNQMFREKATQMVASAMKSKIHLTELQQQTQRMHNTHKTLEEEVNMDALTGLYNRKFLESEMRGAAVLPQVGRMAVIVLDVDYFKEYNDFYGHLKGDIALKEIANCLKAPEAGSSPCRYGGDEFTCILRNVQHEQVVAYIKQVRSCLRAKKIPHEKSPCNDFVTLSIGYALADENAQTDAHLLFQLADQALYQSKRSGRNTYTGNEANAHEQ